MDFMAAWRPWANAGASQPLPSPGQGAYPVPNSRLRRRIRASLGHSRQQLEARDYLVGPGKGKYSIADIANFSWCNWGYFAGVDVSKFKNVEAWLKRIDARPAAHKGVNIPSAPGSTTAIYRKKLTEDKEFAEKETGLNETTKKAKEQCDYKYKSP